MPPGEQGPPNVHTIATQIAGRYLVHPPGVSKPSPVLVGFHGYGESAEHHLRELAQVPGAEEWLLVSVQALSRFYERKTGTVVASWMTSQDRNQMIADNVAYIDSVVATVTHQHETTSTLVYSGFSQGVAMAYRAALMGARRPSCANGRTLGGREYWSDGARPTRTTNKRSWTRTSGP